MSELEFKAEVINGNIKINPVIEEKEKEIIVRVPSLRLINKFNKELNKKEVKHG